MAPAAQTQNSTLAQDIINKEKDQAREFAQLLEGYDPADKETFSMIIGRCARYGLTQTQLAETFSTTPPTISRWSNGRSVPPQYSRGVVVERIRDLLKQ